jgi:hypothetical protein
MISEELPIRIDNLDFIVDDVTLRKILPSGKLGPNLLINDSTGWKI